MSRPIKFRVWGKRQNKMFMNKDSSDSITLYGDGSGHFNGDYRDYDQELEDFVLMQFTGLHDKNGKEIWEGDIVMETASNTHGGGQHVVEIDEQCGGFYPFSVCGCTASYTVIGYEVLGNIYENPELLK